MTSNWQEKQEVNETWHRLRRRWTGGGVRVVCVCVMGLNSGREYDQYDQSAS